MNAPVISLRQVARRVGLGRALLWLRRWTYMTPRQWLDFYGARRNHLSSILRAPPLAAHGGTLEVHMLLNHARAWEGMWSVYSFLYFSAQPAAVIIHDDGTLTPRDCAEWQRVFPGVQIIARAESDARVNEYFRAQNLTRCETMRTRLAYALKLFDPCLYGEQESFVILDSDVLFYAPPREMMLSETNRAENLYSVDNGYRYALPPEVLDRALGQPCIERFNPGMMRVRRDTLSFAQVEEDLQLRDFWMTSHTPQLFAELTLWAMALTRAGAHPLPPAYAICPYAGAPGVVAGHYCGGGYWASLYYTQGLPYLRARIFSTPRMFSTPRKFETK